MFKVLDYVVSQHVNVHFGVIERLSQVSVSLLQFLGCNKVLYKILKNKINLKQILKTDGLYN